MSNLPDWPGASVVYSRVQRINSVLCARAYLAFKLQRGRRKIPYRVPTEVEESIQAMNEGNEEALKAYVLSHIDIALES